MKSRIRLLPVRLMRWGRIALVLFAGAAALAAHADVTRLSPSPPRITALGASAKVFNPYLHTLTWRFAVSEGGWIVVDIRRSGQDGPLLVRDLGWLRRGSHGFTWSGRTSDGRVMRAGWYWFHVTATGAAGSSSNLAFGGVHLIRQNPQPALAAQAAFLLDDTTGSALFAANADVPRYPASTIKMMTAIVTLQRLKPGTVVTVPGDALVGETTAGLVAGERMTVRDLLYGLLLPSGNDAAIALADATAGSTDAFAALMNAEAVRFHLWHTHFLSPHGFDLAGQYSTARDLAWLAHDLLRLPILARIVVSRTYHATSADGRIVHDWTNRNQLLWTYPGAIGVKTGTTPLAGANLVAAATRDGHRLIAVILGSTGGRRFADGSALLDYGLREVGP